MKNSPRALATLLASILALVLVACGGGKTSEPAIPVETATPRPVDLHASAESRLVPSMKPELADFVRGQAWYATGMSQDGYNLVEKMRDGHRTAQKHGTELDLMTSLRLATEQPWYQDGLDEQETKGIGAMIQAYSTAIDSRYPFDITEALDSTLRGAYFRTLGLPESGEVTLIVATDEAPLGPQALELAVDTMPKVESIVGKFPYPFLFIWVTDLGDFFAGLSSDEFIWINTDAVDVDTMAHEMTHSTLYGIFPTWFEEGFAYFTGSYVDDTLPATTADAQALLASVKKSTKLDLNGKYDHSRDIAYFTAISQGYLFFKGLYDIEGIEGLGRTVRALRSGTYANDNQLIRAIVSNGPPEHQAALQQFICSSVLNLRSGC